MAALSTSLIGSMKSAIGGEVVAKKASSVKSQSTSFLKISAKNFLSISGFARDLNVAKRNIEQLVELMGGKPVKGDKVDAHFLKEEEREKKLEVERSKGKEKSPEPVKPKKKEKGLFDKLKEKFSANKILKSLGKFLVIGAIITTIFVAFKDTFAEWISSLWGAIKESFDGFIEKLKGWFNDVVQPIVDGVKEFIDNMINTISEFFQKIGDWFVEKFGFIKEIFEPVVEFISKIWNKFMGMIDEFKSFLKPKVETAMKLPGIKSLVPEFLKTWLGIGVVPKEISQQEDEVEKKKLERQQKEIQDTERVRKQEEQKQYKGNDEIVRKRLGIEEKTMTMRSEEAKKPTPTAAPAAAPPTAAAPTPAPAPAAAKPSAGEGKSEKLSANTGKKAMIQAMDDAKITDPTARAAIMAQVGHESGNFTTLSENLNYRGSSLIKLFPKKFSGQEDANAVAAGGPEKVAERIYGGRMGNAPEGGGDGFKYRGRGFIQLTGKQNYTRFGYSSNPDSVAEPKNAADSAIKYMMGYKGDWSDIKAVTKFVNGGFIGLEDRAKHFQEYKNDPEITKVGAVASAPSGGGMASSSTTLAADQRAQQKPTTPVVINAPTNNTTVVNKTQTASAQQKDTSRDLIARAA